MIKKFDALPTHGFLARTADMLVNEQDSKWFAQAVEATRICKQLMEYISVKAREDSFIDDGVIAYVLTGMDWDSFVKACKDQNKTALREQDG